ncbi:MAG: MBL fold metallo-hydrolase [Negativicutes bacterium]|nr:MBL fold metallo-hydrolase [Negativicutes bacterium]
MNITFLGAAMTVTGSSFLIETGDAKILVDCGMFQGSKTMEAFNRRPFPYNPADIDCVILTHSHIDHSGLLPKLVKEGFRGPVYATKATTELCGIMLPDSAHIQEFDAEIDNRKGLRAGRAPVEPLYTVEDAQNSLKYFKPTKYDTEVSIAEQVVIRFRDAGHILGSSILEIWVTEAGKTSKVVFSGDLGQPGQPIIKDPVFIGEADFVIMESTYGNRSHEEFADKEGMLAEVINKTVERGGNVVIPAFAVGRTQILLYYLHRLFTEKRIPDIPVVIDSPLAISATDIFKQNPQDYDAEAYNLVYLEHDNPLTMPQLTFARTAEESKELNSIHTPLIIISASGMANAGRIQHHLKHNLWRPEASVLFVGYQAEGTLGRRLLEGAKKVRIMGEEISVKAEIVNLEGFSAHADQQQLLHWLSSFRKKPRNVFLVHGEADAIQTFAGLIHSKVGVTSYIPRYGDKAVITGDEWRIEPSEIVTATPALQQFMDYLVQWDVQYQSYRRRIEQLVQDRPERMPEIIRRMEKLGKIIRRTMNELF